MKFCLAFIAGMAAIPAISSSGVPITEIITGIANDRLNADHSLINTLRVDDTVSELLEETWGPRFEEPGVWQGFITWKPTKEDPPTLQNNRHFNNAASQIFTQYNFTHVPFAPFVNLTKSVTSPITETIFSRILPGADPVEFEAATQHALDVAGAWPGCLSGAHGHRIENNTQVVMVLGWVNKAAHESFVAGNTIQEAADRFFKVAAVDRQFHVIYTNFLNSSGCN